MTGDAERTAHLLCAAALLLDEAAATAPADDLADDVRDVMRAIEALQERVVNDAHVHEGGEA